VDVDAKSARARPEASEAAVAARGEGERQRGDVTVLFDSVAAPCAYADGTVIAPHPWTVEDRAVYWHEVMHVRNRDALRHLPTWRREAKVSERVLRLWHDEQWPGFGRAAARLAQALSTYIDAEDVPRVIVEHEVPRALRWELYR
jgi:hypothetical protein